MSEKSSAQDNSHTNCDHTNVQTPFCPYCGEDTGHPLYTLRKHCLKRLGVYEDMEERGRQWCEKQGEKYESTMEPRITKWRGWVEALNNAIKDLS